MAAYYNEIDPYAADWLRNLIKAGHIAPGVVDERSIEDVAPSELTEFTQCHFFAGVGVWAYALRRAGIPDDYPVWTGSCPCQPFSAAGKGDGFDDERHLWPAFHFLIEECRPAIVFGEQVASKPADAWIDLVQTDMESMGYGFGAVPFPSAGVGAPHIRDRLYWVGYAERARLEGHARHGDSSGRRPLASGSVAASGVFGGVADAADVGLDGWRAGEACNGRDATRVESERLCDAGGVADADSREQQRVSVVRGIERDGQDAGRSQGSGQPEPRREAGGLADAASGRRREECADSGRGAAGDRSEGLAARLVDGGSDCGAGPTNGFWRNADWIGCRDGKFRPIEPGTFPLANGAASRVGRLRAYGNAINAEAARVFIVSAFEAIS